jgi:hypothetical protein
MSQIKESNKEELMEITLSDDSNIILPEVSFPTSYTTQGADIKYGAKYHASEHEILEYQKRVSSSDKTLTPTEIRDLISETTKRRRALEQSIAEQKEHFQQKRAAELQARHSKEREEARQYRISHENETQHQMRLAAEEELKTERTREIQILENKCRREKEEVETFFLQSSGRFNSKYGIATKQIVGDTGVDRIISSRTFSTNRYAHRCIVCGYHYQESLSISKIYQHIYENKDRHMQFTINEIDKYYETKIAETRRKHTANDNPNLKQQKLANELEGLKKLKGAKYR